MSRRAFASAAWALALVAPACRFDPPQPDVDAVLPDAPVPTACGGAADVDGDGWHAAGAGGRDCDDGDPAVADCAVDSGDAPCVPVGPETCDGTDEDCDGFTDDPWVQFVAGAAKVVAAGRLLADGAPALVVGEASDLAAQDGAVAIYDLDGALVVRITGLDQSPSFGSQLATGRDLTGDGVEDLVVAAPFAETGDGPNSGRVFVFAGPLDATTTLADAVGWFEGGELDGQPGGQLAVAPDLDGDGRDELVVGYYRHTLVFSGAPGPAARRADAWLDLELNTGGGPWHFASWPDHDGDGRAELLVGMETYSGGAGLVAAVLSSAPTGLGTTWTDAAHPGLGSKLTVVDGAVWTLSGTTPLRLDDGATLAVEAVALADGGDLDGDGAGDLLVETPTGIIAPGVREAPFPAHLQGDRDLSPADDLDGDAVPDLRLRIDGGAALGSGAGLFRAPCDADGDGVSGADGDCDDTDADVLPGAHDVADGIDQDCDGAADLPLEAPLAVGLAEVVGLARTSTSDGLALGADGAVQGYGVWADAAPTGVTQLAWVGDAGGSDAVVGVQTAAAAWLLPPGAVGDPAAAALAFVGDGVGLARSGPLGTVGDLDGDGVADWLLSATDPVGHRRVAVFAGPVAGGATLDDAATLLLLPDGWTTLTLPLADAPGDLDLDWDGHADLVAASAEAYYGQGRVGMWSELARGTVVADGSARVDWYGEPGEALGLSLVVADRDGAGLPELLIGTADGVRVVRGGACPELYAREDLPATSLGVADLDGDRRGEAFGLYDGWLWRDGAAWRPANVLLGTGDFGVVWTAADGAWQANAAAP